MAVSGRRDEAGQALAAELRAVGVRAEYLRADVRHESEVRSHDGRWYLLRIRPYRTQENRIDGAVMAFHRSVCPLAAASETVAVH